MSKGTILVVEPDDNIRDVVKVYFSGQGYQVLTCETVQDAIDSARKQLPSVILTEIDLPDKSGFDLVLELRQTTRTSHIPIIFITHRDSREDKIKGIELGADDYVVKPIDIDALEKHIKQIIRSVATVYDSWNITGLPTGYLIEEHLRKIMQQDIRWVYLDIRIGSFEVYKEVYGWTKGDEVLKKFADLLRDVWQGDFIGHPGGDNFVVITEKAEYESLLDALSVRFRQALTEFYHEAEIKGDVVLVNGTEKPLMSLSFGVFDNAQTKVKDIREITELAAEDRRRKQPGYVESNDDEADILTAW